MTRGSAPYNRACSGSLSAPMKELIGTHPQPHVDIYCGSSDDISSHSLGHLNALSPVGNLFGRCKRVSLAEEIVPLERL